MLQIILFILKFIGWILLLILGLLVLVLVAALFTPLRYQVETRCRGKLSTLEAGMSFRIFFRLISGSLQYRDGKLSWNIRAAWIRLGDQAEYEDVEKNVGETIEEAVIDLGEVKEDEPEHIEEQEKEVREEKPENAEASREKKVERISENLADTIEEKTEKIKNDQEGRKKKDQVRKKSDNTKKCDIDEAEQNTKESLADKIAAVFEKIKYTFDRICDKIKMLSEKAESVKVFLTDEAHQSAFLKCFAELKKMLIRLRPKYIAGEVHFGFEDPSLTGRVLAGVSMLYPYWGEYVCCYPDFERKVLEGEVSVKGSLRLLPAAILIWNLLWNKNVRRTLMDVKRSILK